MISEFIPVFGIQTVVAVCAALVERWLSANSWPVTIAETGRFLCLIAAGWFAMDFLRLRPMGTATLSLGVLVLLLLLALYAGIVYFRKLSRSSQSAAVISLSFGLLATGLSQIWMWAVQNGIGEQ